MLQVNIEKIIPVTEARDMFNQIVEAVEGTDELYVLTKNGKPAAVVVGVNHLEKLTGEPHTALAGTMAEESADQGEDTVEPQESAEAGVADEATAAPEEGETVFASADDVQAAPDVTSDNTDSGFPDSSDPFAPVADNAGESLPSTESTVALDAPVPAPAETDLAPAMPTLESTGALDTQADSAALSTASTDEASATASAAPTFETPAPVNPADTSSTPVAGDADATSTEDGYQTGPVIPPRQF